MSVSFFSIGFGSREFLILQTKEAVLYKQIGSNSSVLILITLIYKYAKDE
jgi:hypothetical protein